MSDTPRTEFVAHATGDAEWNRSINRFGRMMAHACILERELAVLRLDAERYRWLRNDKRGRSLSVSSLEWTGNPELSDAAVDAAMKEEGK